MKRYEEIKKKLNDEKTIERVFNNPMRVNQEYESLHRARPKVTDAFKKDLHFTDLRSRLSLESIIDSVAYETEKAVKIWIKLINKLFKWKTHPTKATDKYLEQWLEEQYWLFRGSVLYETKRRIIDLMKQAIDESWTIWKLSLQVEKLSNTLFGKTMATAVSITEIHNAFENWKRIAIQDLVDEWRLIQKYWLTCNDDRVRETHMEAQKEGRVDIDHMYNSVWVRMPPWWYNCRCNLLYKEI